MGKDKRLSKKIKDEYPELEDLMFKNKDLIKKDKEKKKYKEWLRDKRRNY